MNEYLYSSYPPSRPPPTHQLLLHPQNPGESHRSKPLHPHHHISLKPRPNPLMILTLSPSPNRPLEHHLLHIFKAHSLKHLLIPLASIEIGTALYSSSDDQVVDFLERRAGGAVVDGAKWYPFLHLEIAAGLECCEGFGEDGLRVMECESHHAAVDVGECIGPNPFVFHVVYFKGEVCQDTGRVRLGKQRAKRGAQFWLDATEIAADYFGVGILLCWEFSEWNPY
jgi:hypothetical protein